MTPDTYNIVPNGIEGAMLWLNNYCDNKPLEIVEVCKRCSLRHIHRDGRGPRQGFAPDPEGWRRFETL